MILLAKLSKLIKVIPIKLPRIGIKKWNIPTNNGNILINLFSETVPKVRDKEKVSIDKDIPISKMDTISLMISPKKLYARLAKFIYYFFNICCISYFIIICLTCLK